MYGEVSFVSHLNHQLEQDMEDMELPQAADDDKAYLAQLEVTIREIWIDWQN